MSNFGTLWEKLWLSSLFMVYNYIFSQVRVVKLWVNVLCIL